MHRYERVKLEDVHPSQSNPRHDFGDLDALAESLEATHGEPVNPIVVVRDGGIFWLVDGERRFRAMRKLKTHGCGAIVCDDFDEADTAVAMLATDDKKPLTDGERSLGVQRALLLGVSPVAIDKAARLKRGTASRAAKSIKAVGGFADCETMSLDQLLAIDECGRDEEAAKRIATAGKDWKRVADAIRREREHAADTAVCAHMLEEAGIAIADEAPDCKQYAYSCLLLGSDAIGRWLERKPDKRSCAVFRDNGGVCYRSAASVAIYLPIDAEEVEAKKAKKAAIDDAMERIVAMRRDFNRIAANVAKDGLPLPVTVERLMLLLWPTDAESLGVAVGKKSIASGRIFACLWWGMANLLAGSYSTATSIVEGEWSDYILSRVAHEAHMYRTMMEELDGLEDEGFTPSAETLETLEAIEAATKEAAE